MRRTWWVLVLGVLATVGWPLTADAQSPPAAAVGQIETIGIGNLYRPGDWVPVRVRIDNPMLEPGTYTVRIEQRDADGQRVAWTRQVPLGGGSSGPQRFEVYFKPDPLDGGLPGTVTELRRRMRATLVDPDRREVGLLQLPTAPRSVEASFANSGRDVRLVVAVTPTPVPQADYGRRDLRAVIEDTAFVEARPEDLPRSVLGYDMADAVLWGDYSPAELDSDQRAALEEFVRRGGHLVILQRPSEPMTLLEWRELLPVTLTGTTTAALPGLLAEWATEPPVYEAETRRRLPAQWPRVSGTAAMGLGVPKPNAVVEYRQPTTGEALGRPLLVRQVYGTGAVSWLAIDPVATPALQRVDSGWSGIWARVFGWAEDPAWVDARSAANNVLAEYDGASRDLGTTMLEGMRLSGRSTALVGVALLFFIGYWLVAGPGLYLYLVAKKRPGASWFAFGGAAVAATLLTVLIVNLVLRGDPQVRHLTLFRATFDNDAPEMVIAHANIGLYIPRDGEQALALRDIDPGESSTIGPYIGHPRHYPDSRSTSGSYDVRVVLPGEDVDALGTADIPYRSTLKKLEATWRGVLGPANAEDPKPRIEGRPALTGDFRRPIRGTLLNATGQDLTDVWLAYRRPASGTLWDELLYVPSWQAGTQLNLDTAWFGSGQTPPPADVNQPNTRLYGGSRVAGTLSLTDQWAEKFGPLRGNVLNTGETYRDLRTAVPVLSFFERITPIRNDPSGGRSPRVDLRRLNARDYDLSPALLAGALCVVATAEDAPLPVPMTVEGDPLQDTSGTTVYQFVLPIDRAAGNTPTTQPTTQPADRPSERAD